MSRLFNKFIEEVFSGNPYARDSELGHQIDAEHEEWHHERDKWLSGEITLFNGGSVEEWVKLGRPKNPNI